jgi:hypothetical protein
MQRGDPNQISIIIAVTMTSADLPRVDPAFDGAGVTLDGCPGHGFLGRDCLRFTYPPADTAIGAPVVIDDSLFFHQFNGLDRTIPDTIPAAGAFFLFYFHFQKFFGFE